MIRKRKTPQLKTIKLVLNKYNRPLLPREILDHAQQLLPTIGIATVFRALKDLVDEGSARAVHIGDEAPRYETTLGHHHHFKCIDCDIVFDVFSCPGNMEKLLPAGFQLLDHEITLFGKCSHCLGH